VGPKASGKLLTKVLSIISSYSAWNDRTNSYKNADFDIVIDQAAQQGRVFELAGLHDLVKHVAEVSIIIILF
jgi:hypothetical protein